VSFMWGTIADLDPLRVRLDGDTSEVPVTPDSLIDPLSLAVNDRVRVELSNNRLIVLGRSGGSELPSGMIMPTALSLAPAGWLSCDGSAVSRTTYSKLFLAISTWYGVGDGTTTFALPNIKGRFVVGHDPGQTEFDVRGEKGGTKVETLSTSQIPRHVHPMGSDGGNVGFGEAGGPSLYTLGFGATRTINNVSTGGNAGGGGSHNNLPPYIALPYMIKT